MKYEILEEETMATEAYDERFDDMINITLKRIRALENFGDVRQGDLGGWVENESNLSSQGNCWIYDESIVCNGAKVSGNAKVIDRSKADNGALVTDNAIVSQSILSGACTIKDNAMVNDSRVFGTAIICDNTTVSNSLIRGSITIGGGFNLENEVVDPDNALPMLQSDFDDDELPDNSPTMLSVIRLSLEDDLEKGR